MAEIKAFVAHSFSETDKELIGIFVEHFNSLASSFPGFTWDHAQQAEAESVSDKVLAKIEGKNVLHRHLHAHRMRSESHGAFAAPNSQNYDVQGVGGSMEDV